MKLIFLAVWAAVLVSPAALAQTSSSPQRTPATTAAMPITFGDLPPSPHSARLVTPGHDKGGRDFSHLTVIRASRADN